MKISDTHMAYLKMFEADTYGMEIPYSIAKTMEIKGLIKWVRVPPQFGTRLWAITKKGIKARALGTSDRREES